MGIQTPAAMNSLYWDPCKEIYRFYLEDQSSILTRHHSIFLRYGELNEYFRVYIPHMQAECELLGCSFPSFLWVRNARQYIEAVEKYESDEANKVKLCCSNCGCVDEILLYSEDGNEMYCKDCAEEHFLKCPHCGRVVPSFADVKVGGEYVCHSCLRSSYRCGMCGDLHHSQRMTPIGDLFICERCEGTADIGVCLDCGNRYFVRDLIPREESGGFLCGYCYNRECYEDKPEDEYESDVICEYHEGPYLNFFGSGKYHMGVELEVDGGCSSNRCSSASDALVCLGRDRAWCSEDGSLNTGFELITHPHTYKELISLPWESAFRSLSGNGWRGHDVETAGLHVHIGREAFNDDDAIIRFCSFFENNWAFVRAFSRRESDAIDRWASRYVSQGENTIVKVKDLKDEIDNNAQRYRVVNTLNDDTIEVRIFRSTLNLKTFLSSIELVYLITEKCNMITDEEAEVMSVSQWLEGGSDMLFEYCASRGHALIKNPGLAKVKKSNKSGDLICA